MRIEVLEVARRGDDLQVTFRTSIGTGLGRWRGRGEPARSQYDVEFGFEGPPSVTVVHGQPAIEHDGENTTVRALAEVEPDGFVYARLAKSGLAMIGFVPDVSEDQTISMRMPWRDLTLWPTGIDAPLR